MLDKQLTSLYSHITVEIKKLLRGDYTIATKYIGPKGINSKLKT